MFHKHTWRRCQHISALFCMLLLFSACGQLSNSQSPSTSTPARTATMPAKTTATPTPTTSTTKNPQPCPLSALVSPQPTSTHPTLVYVTQQGDSSLLQRYDVTTGSRQTLLTTLSGETIQSANISQDGKWIIFISNLQGQEAIQMIGVNGQQLQTLYCVPAQETVADALLSPDSRTLAFNVENQDETISVLYLLDMTTGKLRTELSSLQPNFPGIVQGQTSIFLSEHVPSSLHHSTTRTNTTSPFNPLPSTHYLIYVPMKWANNTSLYVYGTVRASGSPVHDLALLLDTRKDVMQQGSNLQAIATNFQNFACQDDDVTPDNGQLVCSAYTFSAFASPNAIKMWPIVGGTQRVVYQGQVGADITARARSNSTLLYLFIQPNRQPALGKINTDGSGKVQLMTVQTSDAILNFASSSYLPWSITSRDGEYYALTMYTMTSNMSSVIVGKLDGSQSKTIASSTALLQIAGWV